MKSSFKYVMLLVLPLSLAFLCLGQAEAKKPKPPEPYEGELVTSEGSNPVNSIGKVEADSLFGVLIFGQQEFEAIPLNPEITLFSCDVIVTKSRGKKGNRTVNGVRLIFYTGGNGIHQTDVIPASANGLTVNVGKQDAEVYKQSGPDQGTVAGTVSVGDVVYSEITE